MTFVPFPTVTHIVASVWNFHSNPLFEATMSLGSDMVLVEFRFASRLVQQWPSRSLFRANLRWMKPLGENGNSSIRTLAVVSQRKRVKLETLLGMLICTKICSSINVVQLHFHIISQHLYVLLQLIYTLLLDHFVSKVQKLTSGFFNSSLKCLRKRLPRRNSEPSTIPLDFLPSNSQALPLPRLASLIVSWDVMLMDE